MYIYTYKHRLLCVCMCVYIYIYMRMHTCIHTDLMRRVRKAEPEANAVKIVLLYVVTARHPKTIPYSGLRTSFCVLSVFGFACTLSWLVLLRSDENSIQGPK